MRPRPFRFRHTIVPALLFLSACFIVRTVRVQEVSLRAADSVRVRSAVKAHLIDGSTVVYPEGVLLAGDTLRGPGTRYDLTLGNPVEVRRVPLDSIVGMESFRTTVNTGATIGYSTLVTVGAIGIGVAIACAADPKCFGSCPTYYSDSSGTAVLEAEGFSYSIAPLFEARDLDRLRARAAPDGELRLEVRNEAFETHYLNHLELIEARHMADEFVASSPQGQPVALRGLQVPVAAHDRAGRDVLAQLRTQDGETFRTDSAVLASTSLADYRDYIDLTFPAPGPNDSLVLLLRLRNSLLNTVLLYDIMLGEPGARSLDWQAEELERVGPALELGTWYAGRMGLAVLVPADTGYREVARVKDTGPVAWKDIAVPLAPASGDSVRLRLAFVADNWRIDRVALGRLGRPELRTIPFSGILGRDDLPEPDAANSLARPDESYLQTSPGQRFIARWETGPEPTAGERTFLLASQGYYIEWVRQGWIAGARDTVPFVPGDAALVRALSRWRTVQDSLEARFFATRVPVR